MVFQGVRFSLIDYLLDLKPHLFVKVVLNDESDPHDNLRYHLINACSLNLLTKNIPYNLFLVSNISLHLYRRYMMALLVTSA